MGKDTVGKASRSKADLLNIFRVYMRLERKRSGEGLSLSELKRWRDCKRVLNGRFQPDLKEPDECRRQSLRFPLKLDVCFESYGELQEKLMTNLSRGGLFIETQTPLEIGTKVSMKISVGGRKEPIELMAEVTSQNLGPDFERNMPGMGLRFIDMDSSQSAAIDALYRHEARKAVDSLSKD